MKPSSENELIERVLNGDKAAYQLLFKSYYNYCLRKALIIIGDQDAAKDLVQEGFMQAYFCLKSLKDKNAFKPWLGGIMNNVCKNYIRINSCQYKSLKQYFEDQQDIETQEKGKVIEIITKAIHGLNKQFSEIIHAFYYDGKSINEISTEFGITTALAKVRLHRARKELKAILEKINEIKDYQPHYKNKKTMKEVKIIDLIPSGNDLNAWVIVLLEEESNLVVPIVISTELADAMAAGMKGVALSRPLTHNLVAEVFINNDLQPESVCITDIENGVYISVLKIKGQDGIQNYDARPSDALNIAVRTGCPVFVSQTVLQKTGMKIPEKYLNQTPLEKGIGQILQYIEGEQLKLRERQGINKKKSAAELQEQAEKLMSFVFEE